MAATGINQIPGQKQVIHIGVVLMIFDRGPRKKPAGDSPA
jgi:hypothetical protein